ncbi:hypothetical protein [Cellulomonas marina]|uniref:Uncharacterized protein n=1 Tax=Cellulomonas marina TaxID=988821 RepID=A0A1I0ZYN4_9CELL|nr:hypothetical protein [Cellulomonas marina]GIG30565.1 hypothetical protein Cma02nite_31650 [Cellulomonas marina]SFB29408.1 hypothetical protein SAMN05421867_1132 [Cellulomonas marina]
MLDQDTAARRHRQLADLPRQAALAAEAASAVLVVAGGATGLDAAHLWGPVHAAGSGLLDTAEDVLHGRATGPLRPDVVVAAVRVDGLVTAVLAAATPRRGFTPAQREAVLAAARAAHDHLVALRPAARVRVAG